MAKVKVINTNLDFNLNGNEFNNTASKIIFSFGAFSLTSNFDGRKYIDYTNKLTSFVSPITLETLDLTQEQSDILIKQNQVSLNTNNSILTNFVRFGSAYEFLRNTIETIITKYPGSLLSSRSALVGGNNTYYDFIYNQNTNITEFKVPLFSVINNFGLIYEDKNNVKPDNNELKNLNHSYESYVVWCPQTPDNYFEIIGFTGYSDTNQYVKIKTIGNPFEDIMPLSATTGPVTFHIRVNNVIFDEFRSSLTDYQRYVLSERIDDDGFEFQINEPTILDDGNIIYAPLILLWNTSDGYNIDFDTPNYRRFLTSILNVGSKYDMIKTDLISRFLTISSLRVYDTTEKDKMTKLLRTYGYEFDKIRQFIDSLVYVNKLSYDKVNNAPDQIIKNLARTFGWEYFSLINEKEFITSFLNVDETERNLNEDLLPAEIDIELWRRILLNTNYFWKSKGTREAIKSIFLLIGIPEPFINITEYVYTVDGKINPNTVNLSEIDFPSNSYPFDKNGYPKAPIETNDFYFQISGNSDSGQAYMNAFRTAGFKLNQTIDNKKSWIQTGSTIRQHPTTIQYYQEDSRLVLNTKEVDIALDTARGIEYDVYSYIQKDYAVNSSGFALPYSYVNISLSYTGSENTFPLPIQYNKVEGDLEVRFNGILMNGPKTYSGGTGGTYVDTSDANYIINQDNNTFTLTGVTAINNGYRRDVIQATYIYSGVTTQPLTGISVQYVVTKIKPSLIGTTIPLPSDVNGDVQVTINGIALTKGTSQFNADYILNPNNKSEIIIQNPDVISYLNTNQFVQVAYVNVSGSTTIEARSEIHRIDSFNSSKLYYNSSINRFIYKLNYKMNSATDIKVLIDGIALEPNSDYAINVNNSFEIFLPKKLKYGSVISVYYLVGGSDIFNPIVSDSFGIGDISELSFLEFLELVQRKMINARNRKTITDFNGGWYPTLLKIYHEYLKRSELSDDNPLQSNGYTFQNLYSFLSKYNSFFQKFFDQLLSATIIVKKSGLLVRNSLFTRQKFTYKRGVSFNPNLNYLGDDGSVFWVQQQESVITPSVVTKIGTATATSINNTGGIDIVLFDAVTAYGIEFWNFPNGILNIIRVVSGLTINNFNTNITKLEPETQYQYRAFIEVGADKYYGQTLNITTTAEPIIIQPSLQTKQGTVGIGSINDTGGINIIGWELVTLYGMQYRLGTSGTWITTPLNNTPLTSSTYNMSISGLVEGQLYQYRAYMLVGGDEYWGQIRQLTTQSTPTTIPSVTTGTISTVGTDNFGVVDNTITSKGGTPTVTKYGIIWTQSGAVNYGLNYNNKSGVDETVGDFSINVPFNKNASGLLPNTMTWYRAFAQNSNGIGYGTVLSQMTNSIAEIYLTNPSKSSGYGFANVGVNNHIVGTTYSLTISYNLFAQCGYVNYPQAAQSSATLEYSLDNGVTWILIDGAIVSNDDGSGGYYPTNQITVSGNITINGISNLNNLKFRSFIDYYIEPSGAEGDGNVTFTLTNVVPNIGNSVIICSNRYFVYSDNTPTLSCTI